MRFIIIVLVMLVYSCSEKKEESPIPKDKFIRVLVEMHLIESSVSFNASIDQSSLERSYGQYKSTFEKFDVDSSLVAQNFQFYSTRPNELLEIYQVVKDSLLKRADQAK